jgi:hypothetical protein
VSWMQRAACIPRFSIETTTLSGFPVSLTS